jgi:altronate dehydratase
MTMTHYSNKVLPLTAVARLADTVSNVAIATTRLEAGTHVQHQDTTFVLSHTVLLGHRFAVRAIAKGDALTSWGLPFGNASRAIAAGEYVCNASTLEALQGREVEADLPEHANFADDMQRYVLEPTSFRPAAQVPRVDTPATFAGYPRYDQQGTLTGVGTRNVVVLLGTSSRTATFVRQLASRLQEKYPARAGLDGIVCVAHTEGGSREEPNNLEQTLRTLAGLLTHVNVAACLAVDMTSDALNNQRLQGYMAEHGYVLTRPHAFMSLAGSFAHSLEQAEHRVTPWLEQVYAQHRQAMPVQHLKVALQCGGSDAFSGISGNPLAALVAKMLIEHGGSANLAETDELIGAESYVLNKVSDRATAERFLQFVERYKQFAASHGTSAEGNPSGGNKFRGLYNIVLKSLGAANKKHPDVRLDAVIDYGERMSKAGFYFMDSPGNDLESIAGQVAAGCNVIFFITGNGSITNFPFVPTIKIVTTSERYGLLENDMDVNAGRYLDGQALEDVAQDTFDLTLQVASGQRSVGEKAGHAQVQLWRDWRQPRDITPDPAALAALAARERLQSGIPIALTEASPVTTFTPVSTPAFTPAFNMFADNKGHCVEPLGLLLPTSLCSGQIARLAAARLNAKLATDKVSRFVALAHTEGCGVSSGSSEQLFTRTFTGYLRQPAVRTALLLEHGCEKTQNDAMRRHVRQAGLDPDAFGWASVQLDGGIDNVLANIDQWAKTSLSQLEPMQRHQASLADVNLTLVSDSPPPPQMARAFAVLSQHIVAAGGSVTVSDSDPLWHVPAFTNTLGLSQVTPNLAYGQHPEQAGFFVMMTPQPHWLETLTGLAATGCQLMLAHISDYPQQAHPLVPLLQVSGVLEHPDLDAYFGAYLGHAPELMSALQKTLTDALSGVLTPKLYAAGHSDMQMTRGLLGVSL